MDHLPNPPSLRTADFERDQDRRQFLNATAMGIVSASAASVFATHPAPAAESGAIRPFRVNIPEEELLDLRRRVWRRRAGRIARRLQISRRACSLRPCSSSCAIGRPDYDWRKVEARLNALAAVHHRDRRRRHSFHSCSFQARQCAADDRHAWLAGLDHRADEDRRSIDRIPRRMARARRTRSIW